MSDPAETFGFVSYAHEDRDALTVLLGHLKPFERQHGIKFYYDDYIRAGDEWEQRISDWIANAKIIIVALSPKFLESDYIYATELRLIRERLRNNATVIPVYFKECQFGFALPEIQAVPVDKKRRLLSIDKWSPRNSGYHAAASQIVAAIAPHVASAGPQ